MSILLPGGTQRSDTGNIEFSVRRKKIEKDDMVIQLAHAPKSVDSVAALRECVNKWIKSISE
ncbi:hypothetical protein KIN20_019175 [Parelaphostrongylus tenuis]|uniref:Uncharacterized protein n=1 Tax=Parelaphostrongylus tenuis TaxID=148309 RepID=A0AAD5MP58_PARTN|nr:hypothetical protein KIN20_019175 [Parelaphostrongylus tenuis]